MKFWTSDSDYRARATVGVGLTALVVLLPFVFVSLFHHAFSMAAGTAAIVAMLGRNIFVVSRGGDPQRVMLYGLVPGGMLFMAYVFQINSVVASVWCYPAILACYCMLTWRRAVIGNLIILAVALTMIAITMEPALAARFAATLIAVSLFASILVREIEVQQRRLIYQIEHDPLTGLLNRTTLNKRLRLAMEHRALHGTNAALLFVDIDHFKRINDRFGHDTGDQVLRECATRLKGHVRANDAVFRMGGEEFLIVLNAVRPMQAQAKGEELRTSIAESPLLQHHVVTVSVGVAMLRADDTETTWMQRSDSRLYEAKRSGRNRVVATDDTAIPAKDEFRLVTLASQY